MHQFFPRDLKSCPETGCHLDCGNVTTGLDHLHIAAADVGFLGKLLLSQLCRISQSIDILAESSLLGDWHPESIFNPSDLYAKYAALYSFICGFTCEDYLRL